MVSIWLYYGVFLNVLLTYKNSIDYAHFEVASDESWNGNSNQIQTSFYKHNLTYACSHNEKATVKFIDYEQGLSISDFRNYCHFSLNKLLGLQ